MFVLQGSAAEKSGMVADFILRLGADICCLTCGKNYCNWTAIAKVTANIIGAHFFDSQFHLHDLCIYKVGLMQQHN